MTDTDRIPGDGVRDGDDLIARLEKATGAANERVQEHMLIRFWKSNRGRWSEPMEKPSELSRRLIAANKENAKLHRFLDVVIMQIKDLAKRVSKIERTRASF